MRREKLLMKILSGSKNISFRDFVNLMEGFGFELSRTRGSHHIYKHKEVTELMNIQNVSGKAKPYQIKHFLEIIEEYNLKLEE
ncbi:MAG: type II toxin-antitoxin system HicA family toxin [Bacteroidales bacterium]|nr:type II toxin-antitoxin system HicA family toxin [Bacteroidales bacterium]MCF8454507.1 type II toxin-antitoxin system HicA family toxin [Bacteroidales bacterium]